MLNSNEKIESLNIGNFKIIQSKDLYRFTSDSVYLSRFISAKNNEAVADICSGSGIVGLHYYALNSVNVKSVQMFEIQKPLADMSLKSVVLNGLEDVFTVNNIAIQKIDKSVYNAFDTVFCNPPYKKAKSGFESENESLAICKHEITVTLDEICKVASALLIRGGRFAMCNKCERLAEVILAFEKYRLSPSRIQFLCGNAKAKPYLFLIEGIKGVNKQLKIENSIMNNSRNFSGE